MALEHKLAYIRRRNWKDIRSSWMQHIPQFLSLAPKPDPGLEKLETLKKDTLPKKFDLPMTVTDPDGIRSNALWEAVFLFHKCAHTSLAAQRLGEQGMHSWAIFNAYHSAYLGAKGIAEMLGVVALDIPGRPTVLLDFFPESEPPLKAKRPVLVEKFNEVTVIPLEHDLDQQGLWQMFQRLIRVSNVSCWSQQLHKDLKNIAHTKITPPRNAFLYKAQHWPLDDMTQDVTPATMGLLVGTDLLVEDTGFLLRLCFSVYRLFEQLIADLSADSAVIKRQLEGSRIFVNEELSVLESYKHFVSQVSAAGAA